MIIWTMKSDSRDSNEAEMVRPDDLSDFKEKKDKCGSYIHGCTE